MITERWRDVEQALPADTRILPIWNAWDSARDEVSFDTLIIIFNTLFVFKFLFYSFHK